MGAAKNRRDRAEAGKLWDVSFVDEGREAQFPPNPDYPDGIDVNLQRSPGAPSCTTPLPYPAPRCGKFVVRCNLCNWTGIITAAGRPDDPRSLTVPCRLDGNPRMRMN